MTTWQGSHHTKIFSQRVSEDPRIIEKRRPIGEALLVEPLLGGRANSFVNIKVSLSMSCQIVALISLVKQARVRDGRGFLSR